MGGERSPGGPRAGPPPSSPGAPGDEPMQAPLYAVTLWPHRSLSAGGTRAFMRFLLGCILVFIVMIAAAPGVPTLPGGGTVLLIATAPFFALTLGMVWLAFRSNNRDARQTERLELFADRLRVERIPARGRPAVWEATPHWVRVILRTDRTAENRLLLLVSGKGVELGRFLSPGERQALAAEIETALSSLRAGALRPT